MDFMEFIKKLLASLWKVTIKEAEAMIKDYGIKWAMDWIVAVLKKIFGF